MTDSNQDCSTETNPQPERNSLTRNPIQHKTINFIYLSILYLHTLSVIADKLQMNKKSQQMQNKAKLP